MSGLQDIDAVASNFVQLHGLRLVPLSLPFVALAAGRVGWLAWVPGNSEVHAALWFVLVAIAFGLSFAIGHWYRRCFGQAPPIRGGRVLVIVAGILAGLIAAQHAAPALHHLPLQTAFISACLIRLSRTHGGARRHYLVIGLLWLLFACSAPLPIPEITQQLCGDFLLIVSLVAGGVGDHLVLARVIGAP